MNTLSKPVDFRAGPGAPPVDAPAPGPSPEAVKMRDAIMALTPLLRDTAWQSEKETALVPEALQALDKTGFFRITLPAAWGGSAFGARDLVEVIAAASYADGSAGWSGFAASGIRMVLAFSPQAVDEVSKQIPDWVGPAAVGASIFSNIVGQARRTSDGFMVTGKWMYGSGCRYAAWAVVGIEWEEENKPVRGLALISKDQYEILDDWHVMGMAASSSNSIVAREEIFVPAYRVVRHADLPVALGALPQKYEGLTYRMGPLATMLSTALANIAITLGMARGCLDCFIEQANKRVPFNLPYETVAAMASTQVVAGRVHARIKAAEALILQTADEVDARTRRGEDFMPREESLATMSLVYAANLCGEAIDEMQLCIGSSTVSLRNPIQRFARDARVMLTHGAIRRDPAAEIAGRHVLGLPPFNMFAGGLAQR
ncbi:oxidoreductase [Robbsia andropogonis]|uniref:Oxidoreductase n=1 Tax=Robbsia andropogonis TaxID=28092 RepID=A0A0F5JV47_9BURK|nr:acyl-CoA dehydrogenase family protein [Robbsia andropogonis]KKB61726.1 oxidoreductase [Robbsia andropogonis]MCP1120466.1 oxidoreductase [Robbsia andropogonis]MCP1130338.1 oxidoreductase [Robbsia andropogonis]